MALHNALTEDDRQLFLQLGRQQPRVVETLTALRTSELERLALTNNDEFRTLKGRVQMLTEIRQLFSPS